MAKAKVVHRTDKLERSKLRGMVANFTDKVVNSDALLGAALNPGGLLDGLNWKSQEPLDLLRQRTRLIDYLRKGMLERKDMEREIALLAAVIWTNRLSQAEHDRVMGLW